MLVTILHAIHCTGSVFQVDSDGYAPLMVSVKDETNTQCASMRLGVRLTTYDARQVCLRQNRTPENVKVIRGQRNPMIVTNIAHFKIDVSKQNKGVARTRLEIDTNPSPLTDDGQSRNIMALQPEGRHRSLSLPRSPELVGAPLLKTAPVNISPTKEVNKRNTTFIIGHSMDFMYLFVRLYTSAPG